METDCSQIQHPGTSILGEVQVSLCDESMKRNADSVEGIAEKKSKKKRRSSLSSHRRSITGDIIPKFHIDTESGSQESSESSSQKTPSDDSQPTQETKTNEPCLLPNPVNLQMDAIVDRMRQQITVLNNEYTEWGNLLVASEEQEETSKQMALNLNLAVNDIPANVKEIATSKYLTSKLLDLRSVQSKLNGLLLQCRFDSEMCLQDLQLLKETVETVTSTNNYLSAQFSNIADEVMKTDTGNPETTDSRQTILGYQDYS